MAAATAPPHRPPPAHAPASTPAPEQPADPAIVAAAAHPSPNFPLVEQFLREKGLVRQHIDSFNYFVEHDIHAIIAANSIVDSDIDHAFYLRYLDVRVGAPSATENMVETRLYPQECRARDLTYAANIYVDIEYVRNKQIIVKRDLFLGRLPIMLRSSRCLLAEETAGGLTGAHAAALRARTAQECPVDPGGYFIVKGIERVILIQEQLSKNRIIVEKSARGLIASVTSSSVEHKSRTCVVARNGAYYVQSTFFTDLVPVLLVVKAMGVAADQEIAEAVGRDAFGALCLSFEEAAGAPRPELAQQRLARFIRARPDEDRLAAVRALLAERIFPNIPAGTTLRTKGVYLCLMLRRLVLAQAGRIPPDDKDFLGNKRFELAGQLLSILFEDTFKRFNYELKRAVDKVLSKRTRTAEFDALTFFNLQTSIVTTALARAISSGNWNLRRFRMERAGVTSVVTRYSYICALGMMTKVNSHFEKTRKVSGPRGLHTSSWGMFCPADTPEGESCGLVKNLALLAEVTTDADPAAVLAVLAACGVRAVAHCHAAELHAPGAALVYLDGAIHGVTARPAVLAQAFRSARRAGRIAPYCSIFVCSAERAVYIATDNGRMCRPLLIVTPRVAAQAQALAADSGYGAEGAANIGDNYTHPRAPLAEAARLHALGLLLTAEELRYGGFARLVATGRVEYLDANESRNAHIALTAAQITPATTHLEISEAALLGYVAALVPFPHHNQSPRNTYQCAMGKQAIGHIATNVRRRFDAQILQLTYTQKPLAASRVLELVRYDALPAGFNAMVAVMSYSGYDIEDAVILNRAALDRGLARVEVYRTTTVPLHKHHSGQAETLTGVVAPGAHVEAGAVLASKLHATAGTATAVRHREHPAHIDKVLYTRSEDEAIVKIVTRETRRPEIGDKFSSRHGQKGVVGLIVAQTDMPFSEHGLCPDIIMNPHGFPSRMTVGKMLELVTGKAAALAGERADATVFGPNRMAAICAELAAHGFSYSGKDMFTCGTTGEPLEACIFYGPVFYQRLKHMVADKMHCRARGPRAVLTRQPTEGRANDGGFKLGEMERDCIVGYGASELLNERLMLSSDLFEAAVCTQCGVIGHRSGCALCKRATTVPVRMPYACKLLFQELMSMNILPSIVLEGAD